MQDSIIFDKNAQMSSDGSSLKGYLYVCPNHLQYVDCLGGVAKYDQTTYDRTWTQKKILEHLNNITDQMNAFSEYPGHFDFQLTGTYKGAYFDLYEHKDSGSIHIGGSKELDVRNLVLELNKLIKNTTAKTFIL
jgi:hypothetical protein